MVSTAQTLKLLDELVSLGFPDAAFARLHHYREKGRNDTITAHRAYCEKTTHFREGETNELVQRRLKLVLDAYKLSGFRSRRPGVFVGLAEAAYEEIR